MAKLGRVIINGVEYPCDSWEKAQQGEPLAVSWVDGLPDGAGQPHYKSNKQYYWGRHWDATTPPFLRIGPVITTIAGFGTLDTNFPMYVVPEANTDAPFLSVIYVFNKASVWKVAYAAKTIIYGPTSVANVVYGRPVLFDGIWRIPRGESVAAANLIPLTAGTEATEISANVITANVFATHFGVMQDEISNTIVRAFKSTAENSARRIEKATSVTGFTPSAGNIGFEVGDDSFDITDILNSQGELLIIKPDGPYRFDPAGNSTPLQSFAHPNVLTSAQQGSNSIGYSAYGYWVHNTGFYLIFGDIVTPVGLESEPYFYISPTADIDTFSYWTSAFATGRWVYAARRKQIWQGYIRDDGKITWYGPVFTSDQPGSIPLRVAGESLGPAFWFAGTVGGLMHVITLEPDGSTRSILPTNRGLSTQSPEIILPKLDFGRGDRLKQLRKFWYLVERIGAGVSLQAVVQRDGAVNQSWGSAATTSGLFERMGVAGTSDTFRRLNIGFTATGHDGATAGVILEKWGVEAHSADIWKVIIPLKAEENLGSQGIIGSAKNLRELQHGQAIEVTAPGRNSSHTAHVYQVHEKTAKITVPANPEYEFEVLIEAFDIETGVN